MRNWWKNTCSRTGIQYAPVLPVPFLARAKISLPESAIGILASWIGEGFSQPFSNMPIRSSRFRQNSSNSLPRVSVTSYKKKLRKTVGNQSPTNTFQFPIKKILTLVLTRLSFGGIFSFAFQPSSSIFSNSTFVPRPEFSMWLEFICVSVIIFAELIFFFSLQTNRPKKKV